MIHMILTEEKIREAARLSKSIRLDESVYEFSEKKGYDLFISHCFKDKELIRGLYSMFQTAGYNVYIDWIDDPNLNRANVDENTAALIKHRMDSCKAMAYVSTVNSPTSKWCPWELGYGDGKLGKVCIIPVMNGSYNGQEYLKLYPYLEYSKYASKPVMDFWVQDQNDDRKYILLKSWLEGRLPCLHE